MTLCYFDTSALQYRYTGGRHARTVSRTINDTRNTCFISEFTILEIASVLAKACRREKLKLKDFQRMDRKFWEDLDAKRLLVRPLSQTDLLRARHLMRRSAELGRGMTTADSVIATSAMELALERGERVTLFTEDKGICGVIDTINAYKATLQLKRLVRKPTST